MSLNVSLTPELEAFIAEKVESGMYTTASEVVRDGLRLLRQADADREAWRAEARSRIERGWQQAERGELLDGEKVFQKIREKSAARRKKGA